MPHTAGVGCRAAISSRTDGAGVDSPYTTAVLSFVAPDGFPFSIRVPVRVDRGAKRIHVDADPAGELNGIRRFAYDGTPLPVTERDLATAQITTSPATVQAGNQVLQSGALCNSFNMTTALLFKPLNA